MAGSPRSTDNEISRLNDISDSDDDDDDDNASPWHRVTLGEEQDHERSVALPRPPLPSSSSWWWPGIFRVSTRRTAPPPRERLCSWQHAPAIDDEQQPPAHSDDLYSRNTILLDFAVRASDAVPSYVTPGLSSEAPYFLP